MCRGSPLGHTTGHSQEGITGKGVVRADKIVVAMSPSMRINLSYWVFTNFTVGVTTVFSMTVGHC